jgi:peptidoglycan/xylan/chitin deacetylase (PgdA/CDA1 family)
MSREISIVAYHDISSEADALTRQLSLATRPETFRNHVNYFSRNFDLIGEDDLLDGKLPRKPLLITFDDAYRSVLTAAAPVLREANAPSIFFIIPSLVSGDSLPIDNVLSLAVEEIGIDRVADLVRRSGPPQTSVGEMISKSISKMSLKEVSDIKKAILRTLGTTEAEVRKEARIFLEPEDLIELNASGIAVGNHSMSHSHFRGLSEDELDFEIVQSRLALERLSGRSVRSLSVPYGDARDATERTVGLASASGHEAIFLVHARSNRFRRSDCCYYRVSLRNETPLELAAAINIYPVLRSLRELVAS